MRLDSVRVSQGTMVFLYNIIIICRGGEIDLPYLPVPRAGMVELVDTLALGASAERCGSSSLPPGTRRWQVGEQMPSRRGLSVRRHTRLGRGVSPAVQEKNYCLIRFPCRVFCFVIGFVYWAFIKEIRNEHEEVCAPVGLRQGRHRGVCEGTE